MDEGSIAPASPGPLPALPLLNKDTGLDDVERAEDTLPPGGRMNRSTKLGEPNPAVPVAPPVANPATACLKEEDDDGGTGRGGDLDRTAPAPAPPNAVPPPPPLAKGI